MDDVLLNTYFGYSKGVEKRGGFLDGPNIHFDFVCFPLVLNNASRETKREKIILHTYYREGLFAPESIVS